MNAKRFVPMMLVAITMLSGTANAEKRSKDQKLASQLAAAKKRAATQTCELRYRFVPGQTLRWKVVHLGTTETTVQEKTQTSKVRSVSIKVWQIKDRDPDGNITFVHSVESIQMWQKLSDRDEVRYDSQTDKAPPAEYASIAKTVGVPIATVTISPIGRVVKRDKPAQQLEMGLGDIVTPLPKRPVKVGDQWFVAREVRAKKTDGRVKRIKTRRLYTLTSIKTGVATISVSTEVLTPINDPRIKSKLVPQLTKGEIKFDIDAGRLISEQIDWDETVIGFEGHASLMKYLARFTQELLPTEETARSADSNVR